MYESVFLPGLRGPKTLADLEAEAKRLVVINFEEVKQREDK